MPTFWQRNATRTASSWSSAKSTAASATPGQPFNADSTSSSSTLCPRTLTCQHITWSQLANMETAHADNPKMLQIFQSYLESPACESSLPKNSKPSFAHLTASPVEYLFPAVLGALPKAWLSIFKYPLARPGPEICSSPTLPSTTATGRSTSAIAPVVQNPRSTARKASGQPMDTTPAAVLFASKVVVSTAASVGP